MVDEEENEKLDGSFFNNSVLHFIPIFATNTEYKHYFNKFIYLCVVFKTCHTFLII